LSIGKKLNLLSNNFLFLTKNFAEKKLL